MTTKAKLKKKTFKMTTLCFYPCHIYVHAPTKAEAIKILEDKDQWHLVEQEHDIANHQFDSFYVEDIKEFKGRRPRKNRETLTQSELSGVWEDNKEGLSENMPDESE